MRFRAVFGDFIPDIQFALRTLRKTPVFTTVAILSLAVGAGAVSAIFSLADALLLRPLPVPRAREVVTVGSTTVQARFGQVSYPDYVDYRDRLRAFDGLLAYTLTPVSVSERGSSAQVTLGAVVTGNFFAVLEVGPAAGRGFAGDEDRVPGRDAVVVLSDGLWTQRFARDRGVIGRAIRLNGIDFTVVGIAPASFTSLDLGVQPGVFVPAAMWKRLTRADGDPLTDRSARLLTVKGRLASGVTVGQAAAEVAALARALEAEHPAANRGVGAVALAERQARIASSPAQATLVPLLGVLAVTVLVVGCANVAGLQLSRGQTRQKEMAVRLALGSGRFRLVRLLLTESAIVATAGALLGLWLASWMIVFLRRIDVPSDLPITLGLAIDGRVLAATLLIAAASTLLFGLTPALQGLRLDLLPALKLGAAGDAVASRLRGRNVVVVLQVAASFIVLTIAMVVYLGFRAPLAESPGFRTSGILAATIDPKLTGLESARLPDWYRSLGDRLLEIGGVESVAFTSELPMRFGQGSLEVLPDGYVPTPPAGRVAVLTGTVTPRYFETLGIPLLRGRAFRETDDAGSAPVAIVNEAFASTYFPGKDPIGRRVALQDGRTLEVIGLARQSKYTWIAEGPTAFMYLPFAQHPRSRMVVLLGTKGDPGASAGELRASVRAVDPDLPLAALTTLSEFYRRQVVGVPLTLIQTIAALGAIGLALTMIGLYGLVSYAVSLRTRELAIRIALGASRERILGTVLRYGALLSASGVAAGCAAALIARRALLAAFATPTDLPAYVGMAPVVMLVALLAAWLPGRRAARMEPIVILRSE